MNDRTCHCNFQAPFARTTSVQQSCQDWSDIGPNEISQWFATPTTVHKVEETGSDPSFATLAGCWQSAWNKSNIIKDNYFSLLFHTYLNISYHSLLLFPHEIWTYMNRLGPLENLMCTQWQHYALCPRILMKTQYVAPPGPLLKPPGGEGGSKENSLGIKKFNAHWCPE